MEIPMPFLFFGLLLLIWLSGRLAPEIEEPTPPRPIQIIILPDGTRAPVYTPADLARYEQEQRDYYA
jgi:hypothetical protein